MKRCAKCHLEKPVESFHRSGCNTPDGRHAYCKLCLKAYNAQPKERLRRAGHLFDRDLKRAYGITSEDWARMYNSQGGQCAGCKNRLGFDRNTHVDHCHKTGRIRGLLCHGCNVALGRVEDSPETLRRLADYLATEAHPGLGMPMPCRPRRSTSKWITS